MSPPAGGAIALSRTGRFHSSRWRCRPTSSWWSFPVTGTVSPGLPLLAAPPSGGSEYLQENQNLYGPEAAYRSWGTAAALTHGEAGRGSLGVLAVAVEELELVLHPPVGQQGPVQAEQNRVAAVDAADPDREPGGLQHAAHLQEQRETKRGTSERIQTQIWISFSPENQQANIWYDAVLEPSQKQMRTFQPKEKNPKISLFLSFQS